MSYNIAYAPAARRQIKKFERGDQKRVIEHIEELSENPRRLGVKKLEGPGNEYSYRVGAFRIVYEINDKGLTILILKVGDRKEVYR